MTPEPEYTGKWQVSTMECMACGTIQVSVHPVICEYLECYMCHRLMPAPFLEESLEK